MITRSPANRVTKTGMWSQQAALTDAPAHVPKPGDTVLLKDTLQGTPDTATMMKSGSEHLGNL